VKKFFAILLLAIVTGVAGAKSTQQKKLSAKSDALHPKIIIKSMKMLKSTEHYGDELYLVVTEFNSRNDNQQYTIPRYPITWPSRALDQVHDLKVWSGSLYDGDEVDLSIELVEHDAPPFNVDDSIGSAELKLKNNKGKLTTEWTTRHGMTDHQEKKDAKQTSHHYTFKGDGGEYLIKFVAGR